MTTELNQDNYSLICAQIEFRRAQDRMFLAYMYGMDIAFNIWAEATASAAFALHPDLRVEE